MRNRSRLVVRILTPGEVRKMSSATRAVASIKCSQLSSTSRRFFSARRCCSVPRAGRSVCSPMRRANAIVPATSALSLSAASSANHTPSRKHSTRPAATSSAVRVLPMPPVPTRVTSRVALTSSRTWRTTSSRPISGVSWSGRLCLGARGRSATPRNRPMSAAAARSS